MLRNLVFASVLGLGMTGVAPMAVQANHHHHHHHHGFRPHWGVGFGYAPNPVYSGYGGYGGYGYGPGVAPVAPVAPVYPYGAPVGYGYGGYGGGGCHHGGYGYGGGAPGFGFYFGR